MTRCHCDDCRHFPTDFPVQEFEYPKQGKKESYWKYRARVEEFNRTYLALEAEHVCLAGVKMAFRVPNSISDNSWGFYKDGCKQFAPLTDTEKSAIQAKINERFSQRRREAS